MAEQATAAREVRVEKSIISPVVNELSIEATHQILMFKGPEAEEFNIGGVQNFGNWITKVEFHLYNIYFFLQDGIF